jgi:hypothetical protein
MVIIDGPTMATPLTSPVGLKSWIPVETVPVGIGMRGPPLVIGVGSVTKNFICTTPPGGADSSGMCRETWRVGTLQEDEEPELPLVDPDVLVVVEPPLVEPVPPEVLCAETLWVISNDAPRTALPNRKQNLTLPSRNT